MDGTVMGTHVQDCKHVHSADPKANVSHLDMDGAREMAQRSFAGQKSDQDADDGVPVGGWDNGAVPGAPYSKANAVNG